MSRVLVIGDLHEPCTRKGYMQFCKDMYDEWDCDTVVIIGDIADWASISFHLASPEGPGPTAEYDMAFAAIQKWYEAFLKAVVTIGNHDARPLRVAESVKIPRKFFRSYAEMWETPGWNWVRSVIIDNVLYRHGHGTGGGKTPAWNQANKMGMSVVMGHYHSRGGICWSANPLRRWFGMDVGCGVDDAAYAFAYAKEQTQRSILSVGIVLDGCPYHEMMPCGKGEKYHDKRFK